MIAACREMLMQPVYERRLLGTLWFTWALLILAALAALGIGLWLHHWQAGVLIGDVLLGTVGLLWWGALVRVSVLQNLPSHACLVPQLRRRLMQTVAGCYAAGAFLLAAIAALAIGHFGYILCGLAVVFPFVLLQQRYLWLSLMPSVVIFSTLGWLKAPLQNLMRFIGRYDEALVSVLLLCVIAALGVLALRAAFPAGGDGHAEWRAKYLQRQMRMKGQFRDGFSNVWLARRWPGWGNFWRTLGVRVGRDHTGATPGDITQYGLGISVLGAAVSVPVVALLGWVFATAPSLFSTKWPFAWSLWSYMVELLVATAVAAALHALVTAISNRHGEQSLLRLAPAMPAADAVNPMLAGLLLKGFALVWASAALCDLLAAALNAGHWLLDGPTALILVLPLPFFAIVLRDYAAMPQRTAPLGGVSLLAVPAVGLVWLLRWQCPSLCGWVALAVALVSLSLLRRRWQGMLKAPVAFPAGRLA